MNPLEGRIWDLERRVLRLEWDLRRQEAGALFVDQKLREVELGILSKLHGGEDDVIHCSPCGIPKTGTMTARYENILSGTTDTTVPAIYVDDFYVPFAGTPAIASSRGYWIASCFTINDGLGKRMTLALFCHNGILWAESAIWLVVGDQGATCETAPTGADSVYNLSTTGTYWQTTCHPFGLVLEINSPATARFTWAHTPVTP